MANIALSAITGVSLLTDHRAPVTEAHVRPPEPVHQPRHLRNGSQSPGRLESSANHRTNVARCSGNRRIFVMFPRKRSTVSEEDDSNLVKINLEKHPKGYPRVAAYLNSDGNSAHFRRFGDLHIRILLYKQTKLTDLEARLAQLDQDDAEKKDTRWRNAYSIYLDDGKRNEVRRDLMEQIDKTITEYDELLLRDFQLRQLARPSTRTHRHLKDYVYLTNQIGRDEQRFIYHEHDFVSLQNSEESWFDDLMHRFMGHCKSGILKSWFLFVSRADREKTADPYIHYYSDHRLGALIKVIIAGTSSALLLIPIYLFLSRPLSTMLMASITLIFAFLFAAAISVFTSAKRHEVFGATAAYCAVLVVFIGNLQQRQWG